MASEALVLPVEASGPLGADGAGMREGGRHAVVLERTRGIHPFVLQVESAGMEADIRGDRVGLLEESLPFADRYHGIRRGEGQQLMKPVNATEAQRLVAAAPHFLEIAERLWRPGPIPLVYHIQQVAALRAGRANLLRPAGGAAGRADAALVGEVVEGHGW
jgi:hypothetical protein